MAEEGLFLTVPEGSDARTEQLRAIEATFAAVQRAPVHARNPALRPLEVLPLLPDFERWHSAFVQAHFDADPRSELPGGEAATAAAREALARRAFMKSFKAPREEGGEDERLLVYFAPAAGAPPAELGLAVPQTWVREYTYRFPEAEGAMPLVLSLPASFVSGGAAPPPPLPQGAPPPAACYVYVDKRVELRRRVTRAGAGDALPRPSAISLTNRKRTAEEEAEVAAAKRQLTDPEVERPLVEVEEAEEAAAFAEAEAAAAAATATAAIFGDDEDDDE